MPKPKLTSPPTLLRELRLLDGTALVVGGIIGSGIFLVPRSVSEQLDSLGVVLLVWFAGGALSLFGALSLAELGAALPRTGGLFVYLREAYGPWAGFLYGWGQFTMISSGTIATLAVAFSLYLAQLLPLSPAGQKAVGIGSILVLAGVNCVGLRAGKLVQNIFTLAKVGGLGLLVLLLLARGHPLALWSRDFWPREGVHFSWAPFGVALVAVLWAYEGWHAVTFSAGEFKRPTRDLPRSLFLGTAAILAIYLITNLAYYGVLSGAQIAQSDTVAATAMTLTSGAMASAFVSVLILVSIFGANNAQVLLGPRVFYAMAKEGLFFSAFARVHPRYRTPVFSIVAQAVLASVLTLLGTFQELFTYVIFTHWIFYGAAVAAVVVLRRTRPGLERPFRVPAYPWLPLLFVLATFGITVSTIVAGPGHALLGIAFILTGIPAYAFFRRRSAPRGETASSVSEGES